ncbi:hypothetical protein [uncultured Nostoc sp.]|uniref:hypothetical protein n=1 Tax=uncultured Nostoc sp. TaxID=340711 RepID=UPI0035CA02FA
MGNGCLPMENEVLLPAMRNRKVLLYFLNVGWLSELMGRFNWCRRLSKDYEILPATTETFVYIAMIRLMLKQLA